MGEGFRELGSRLGIWCVGRREAEGMTGPKQQIPGHRVGDVEAPGATAGWLDPRTNSWLSINTI
jgi:hypothetical protein